MGLDTSTLDGWASPAALDAAAARIRKEGEAVSSAVAGAADTWTRLNGNYRAPEQNEVLSVFRNINPHGDAVRTASHQAAAALEDFAAEIQTLQQERRNLLADVADFLARPALSDPLGGLGDPLGGGSNPLIGAENVLRARISDLAGRYRQAESDCAESIGRIDGVPKPGMGLWARRNFAAFVGAADGYSDLYTFKSVRIAAYHEVPVPWQEFAFTPLQPGSLTAAEAAGDRYLTVAGREISIHSSEHPDFGRTRMEQYWRDGFATKMDWRPEVNKAMYGNVAWYRTRVDANPVNWRPEVPAAETPSFAELPTGLKGLKVGGWAVSAAMAGVTFVDERDLEYNELLKDDPSMSESARNARADEVGAVKTVTKTGMDIGAGMAGAAVGTAIGGPVGTVVGFGVGMGISYLSDQHLDLLGGKSVKDAAADGAVHLYDGAKDAAVGAWHSLFG